MNTFKYCNSFCTLLVIGQIINDYERLAGMLNAWSWLGVDIDCAVLTVTVKKKQSVSDVNYKS